MATVSRERAPLKPVQIRAVWLKRPVAPCEIVKDGIPGVLSIDGRPYLATLLADLPDRGEPVVRGARLVKADGSTYDIDLDSPFWECSCPDSTYRPNRPGGCRHAAALRQAMSEE